MKIRFPRDTALAAVRDILPHLTPACERVIVAGSLRHRKREVGDAEFVYIPKFEMRPVPGDMFQSRNYDLADLAIREMEKAGILAMRIGEDGRTAYGAKNKLMTHVASGLPVDFFATIESSWWNYLVCRTGPKESNIAIATAAKAMDWEWNPYGSGFSNSNGGTFHVTREEDVFAFVELPFKEPWER